MKDFLLFDGAMGTMLQQNGLKAGGVPELLNLTSPETVLAVHKAYIAAGADVITANTFGANGYKLKNADVAQVVAAGVKLAKQAGAKKVALDIGALGAMLKPYGTLPFETAYAYFAEVIKAGANAGADIVLIETMSDLLEAKCALLAAKENCNLPVFVTMTYMQDGRTFLGTDARTATITLASLGADAVGVNCSLGAKELLPIVREICNYATCPVMVQPNAGLPRIQNGATVYDTTPEEFALNVGKMVDMGVTVVGGCCGTTPAFTAAIKGMLAAKTPVQRSVAPYTAATSATKTVFFDKVRVIGERINPTGKPKLKQALQNGDFDYILSEAVAQESAGADVLDVNVGVPGIDEKAVLTRAVSELQRTVSTPLQLDSSSPEALEAACRIYSGKPIINSVNCKAESLEKVIPIAKKYGALVVGLCLGDTVPVTATERFEYACTLCNALDKAGIKRQDVLMDCLVMTIATDKTQAQHTIDAVKMCKEKLGVHTVLGVSNVSFGMPDRVKINASFLSDCIKAGLDCPIINPLVTEYADALKGILSPLATDKYFTWDSDSATDIESMITLGASGKIESAVQAALANATPMEIINTRFIPALNAIGDKFGKGEVFLPQLIAAAETVQKGMAALPSAKAGQGTPDVVLATVRGDVHDIGKNIVKMLLSSYGFNVLDLGKDVAEADVVAAAAKHDVAVVGLSALMTTTVGSMKTTIEALHKAGCRAKVIVGGAVLSPEHAAMVGADFYAKDARDTVRIVEEIVKK